MADNWIRSPEYTVAGGVVRVYTSSVTGLRGLLVVTDEPLCSLHVVIATEADTNDWSHKDDGLPHTLEHAIFMGSERYPYKGILDKVANRSLADGTNAWIATDHTCYTLTTAGHEGCLTMLPIYADHILYPTLSDQCFTTEIHHITKEGEDKGVVRTAASLPPQPAVTAATAVTAVTVATTVRPCDLTPQSPWLSRARSALPRLRGCTACSPRVYCLQPPRVLPAAPA